MPEKLKICLINPPDVTLEDACWDEPLGLLYLAAMLPNEQVEILDLNLYPDWKMELIKHPADIYGIHCTSALLRSTLDVNECLRILFPEAIRVVGGMHIAADPKSVENEFDAYVTGDGEWSFRDIVTETKGLGKPRFKGYLSNYDCDLNKLPFPARHLIDYSKYHRTINGEKCVGIITARGCPFNCAFCSKDGSKGVRFRSATNVLSEIADCICEYGIKAFSIRDDTFTLDKKRLFELLVGFAQMDITWRCLTRVDQIDKKWLEIMHNAGCYEIVFGIESGNQQILNNLQKGTTIEQNANALDWCREIGIKTKAAVIVGSPGETYDTIFDTIQFIENHPPDKVIVCTLTPYPGSPIWNDPDKFGIKLLTRDLTKYNMNGKGMCGNIVVETRDMTAGDLAVARDTMLKTFKKKGLI